MSKRKSTDLFKADKRRVSKSCSKTTGYIQGHVKGSSSETSWEETRLKSENKDNIWKLWGPYLSERQWATVREDTSSDGNCWNSFPYGQSIKRHYMYGEDGLLGISDNQCLLCQSLVLWNGVDSMLKERLFGVTGPQGNHGEDVKECYYYLRSTPTHSYMEALYKYPQKPFPYENLVEENGRRNRFDREYELMDTGIFEGSEYWDVHVTVAKHTPCDILFSYAIHNRSPHKATICVLPSVWFRNTWSSNESTPVLSEIKAFKAGIKPNITAVGADRVLCSHNELGDYYFAVRSPQGSSKTQWLFTENESDSIITNESKFHKPAKGDFDDFLVRGLKNGVNNQVSGTKCSALCKLIVPAHSCATIEARLFSCKDTPGTRFCFGKAFNDIIVQRRKECTSFYDQIIPFSVDQHHKEIALQAFAGLCWSKQFYCYNGSNERQDIAVRNKQWLHMLNYDIISMPDKWEFPWYASWDLAFHTVTLALIDPHFAKEQLLLMLSERYMHPNGQLPAYEFNFSDANPPVHAWACMKVYRLSSSKSKDTNFLKQCFHKLLLNFSWWVNNKSIDGSHLYGGGFLGLDNISCIDRSNLPAGVKLLQADGTSWMAFYCRCMLDMALELALQDSSYEDIAVKFLDHFVHITNALNRDTNQQGLWNDFDGFYYDVISIGENKQTLRIRSLVGLVSLFSAHILDINCFNSLSTFQNKLHWLAFGGKQQDYQILTDANREKFLLSVPNKRQLQQLLNYLFDTNEFLSKYGIRSLSKFHEDHPFDLSEQLGNVTVNKEEDVSKKENSEMSCEGNNQSKNVSKKENSEMSCEGNNQSIITSSNHRTSSINDCGHINIESVQAVHYNSGESTTEMFGGNSNWRGPIWIAMNYMIMEALQTYFTFFGNSLVFEYPSGSGNSRTLDAIIQDLRMRLLSIFMVTEENGRPCHGGNSQYANDPYWKELLLFYEYFDAETGRGCGASHQTGWTALISSIILELSK